MTLTPGKLYWWKVRNHPGFQVRYISRNHFRRDNAEVESVETGKKYTVAVKDLGEVE